MSFDSDEEIADQNGLTLKEAQMEVSFVMQTVGARADLWPFGLLLELQPNALLKMESKLRRFYEEEGLVAYLPAEDRVL